MIVFDVQEKKSWYFSVKKRLSVMKDEILIEIEPTKTESTKKVKFIEIITYGIQYHLWYFWQIEDRIGRFEKLTILFSAILSTYSLVIIFYGLPNFELRDGFDSVDYCFDEVTIFVAFLSSFFTFMVHNVIASSFRYLLLFLILSFPMNICRLWNHREGKISFVIKTLFW